ncbi:peptidase inhibitor family I36 protein [Streptomyces lasiicapitis]|uniref:peptidase inhibitor family I36 protein n=1 Tax=Streptomyces lasiicapitis TaxID=1923961 RepID=UPI003647E814
MKRKIALALSVISLSAAGIAGTASSASATSTAEQTQAADALAGKLEVWDKNNFAGDRAVYKKSVYNLVDKKFIRTQKTVNDKINSFNNTTRKWIRLKQDIRLNIGHVYVAQPHSKDGNLDRNHDNPDNMNNEISRIKFM